MDTRTGEITTLKELKRKLDEKEFKKFARPVNLNILAERHRRALRKTGKTKIRRNERCPCGSGKKFKKCCLTSP